MMELGEMDKFIYLVREKTMSTFIAEWNPTIDFLHENEWMIAALIKKKNR